MHVEFICKWSFWDGIWTPLRLFSPIRFHKWISTIVSTLVSYHIRSHSTYCTYPWGSSPFNHDQSSCGVCLVVVGGELYRFTSCVLCLQFRDAFATHFSPHQFKVATKGGCEIIIHGIKCTLDLHPDWVVL
jgi:hypothetical protein